MDYQASPKFMVPIHSGLTLTAAEGESKRCLSSKDFGVGAGSIVFRCQMVDEKYIYVIKANMVETAEGCN